MFTVMYNRMLFSLGWLWDDMTKGPSHIALTCAFAILVLIYLAKFIEDFEDSKWGLMTTGALLIAVSGCEVFARISFNGDPTWMLSSFGNFFFSLGVLAVAFFMMVFQYARTSIVLAELSLEGNFDEKYEIGFKSIIVAVVACIIAGIFSESYVKYVVIAYGLFQLYVIGYAIVTAIKNGSVWLAVYSVIIYLTAMAGMLCLFIHFILPAIFCFLLYGWAKSNEAHCYNCRTYGSDGYCSYRNRYVDSNSCCSKHQS